MQHPSMRTSHLLPKIVIAMIVFASAPLLCAELPDPIAPTSKRFDADMKSYDTSVEVHEKLYRDAYLRSLEMERKHSEATKRQAEVTAIDAEIASLKAGPLPAQAPAGLPQSVTMSRTRVLTEIARQKGDVETVRRQTRERYLQWLSKMEAAVKGKDKALEAAIVEEKKRVTPPENAKAK
jgi:hypothetical protein